MAKRNQKLPLLVGFVAIAAYRLYKGRGIFNRVRFKSQHDAISAYLDAHYPKAFYSGITETENGWSCIVTEPGGRHVLHLTKTSDGTFVFWEKKI